jgi:hypothetical protein
MRRALVIAGVMLAGLLAGASALAMAAQHPHVEEEEFGEVQKDVTFTLAVEGFTVNVLAEDNDGDPTGYLLISPGGLLAEYVVPATITDDSLRATFGSLGELNFRFAPKVGKRKCRGELTFSGRFTFTGENDFVHVDADRAEGSTVEGAFAGCTPPYEGIGLRRAFDGVHLKAIAGSRKLGASRRVAVNEWRRRDGSRSAEVSAFLVEEAEGMSEARGAIVRAGPAAFRRNLRAGTATLKPPGPFSGWARLAPGPGGNGTWQGSLTVPILGGEPIELTGPDFRARLFEEGAIDE